MEEGGQVLEAERYATHDSLSCVSCKEHLVGVLAYTHQQRQLSLGEVLGLIHIDLVKDPRLVVLHLERTIMKWKIWVELMLL